MERLLSEQLVTNTGSAAVISDCGRYRYRLDRAVQETGPVYAYFGVNPSTADASVDDNTVKRWRGFTLGFGGSRFIVANVFSYRATDVKELARCDSPSGPDHQRYLEQVIAEADILVPCWGAASKVPKALRPAFAEMLDVLVSSGKPVKHFGLSVDGHPLHPLMLAKSTLLTPWV